MNVMHKQPNMHNINFCNMLEHRVSKGGITNFKFTTHKRVKFKTRLVTSVVLQNPRSFLKHSPFGIQTPKKLNLDSCTRTFKNLLQHFALLRILNHFSILVWLRKKLMMKKMLMKILSFEWQQESKSLDSSAGSLGDIPSGLPEGSGPYAFVGVTPC